MVLRVRPTPTRFPTDSHYTPMDNNALAFYIKCVPPVRQAGAVLTTKLSMSIGGHAHKYTDLCSSNQYSRHVR